MDVHRLEMLLELSRLGSMREVAEEMHTSTSNVSQQIAALAREVGTPLTEPHGRRVRLTPAGRRLADHAVTILAAVEAARLDLDPHADPAGTVRVAGFATAVRRSLFVAVLIGTALNAINQGTEIWAGQPVILWKLLLTYFVPFAVASYGSYAALRGQ